MAPGHQPTLLLRNARVVTNDPSRPRASALAIRDGRIAAVGGDEDLGGPFAQGAILDCEGKTVIPGIIDAHMHLFAYAANLLGVDCSPDAVASLADIQQALRERVAGLPHGQWVRGWGFDESGLLERRPPNRWELDAAAPDHPVKLIHRSGHASVLNSAAMALLGIGPGTPEPPGAIIDRDLTSGELTGYLLEMEGQLEAAGPATLTRGALERGLDLAFQRLLSFGVTSIHEATPTRAPEHWDLLRELQERDRVPIGINKMFGPGDVGHMRTTGLGYGSGAGKLRVGPVKIMLNETGGAALPPQDEVNAIVDNAHGLGWQVAFHAVEEPGIRAACDAVQQVQGKASAAPENGARHRVEHCGVCPPDLRHRLRQLGITVVTQPALIREQGDRYLIQVPPLSQRWLYPVASLLAESIPVAFGSDCPVTTPDPFIGLFGACSRMSRMGKSVSGNEAVGIADALAAYTSGGAYAAFEEGVKGKIAAGYRADLAVLSHYPANPERLGNIAVERTIVGGEVAWER